MFLFTERFSRTRPAVQTRSQPIDMISHGRTTGVRWHRVLLAAVAMAGASVLGSPVPKTTYDQTQQGELNVRADLDNIVVLFVPSGGIRLVDNQQIGNILQLFSNSRKNFQNEASSGSAAGGPNDSPYKVVVDQSAIDRLQSDVDSLNTVIPISKNYGLEKKDNEEKISIVIGPTNPAAALAEDATRTDTSTESEGVPVRSTDEPQSERSTETSKSSPTQEATTMESIVTSQPMTQKMDNESKDNARVKTSSKSSAHKEEKPTSASATPHKPHLKIAAQPSHQRQHQNAKPAVVPGPAKRSDDDADEDQLTKRLRSLQSGLTHCSPGETLAETGDCVKISENATERERRQERMDRLLELLRFGLQPADGSQ